MLSSAEGSSASSAPDAPPKRRKQFRPDEDARLRSMVELYGTHAWNAIAGVMPGRSVRQCRERWKHYLSSPAPNLPWTPDEDLTLAEKFATLGPRWTKLTRWLPGRTDIQIKAHWLARVSPPALRRNRPRFPLLMPQGSGGSPLGVSRADPAEDTPIALPEPNRGLEGPLPSTAAQI
jgi:hypothetical protein